eukprot:m.7245 g.7245  ORF g.7245 m.7245 type:complete len:990 (+) comp3674_c0_seq1:206-3175(+)
MAEELDDMPPRAPRQEEKSSVKWLVAAVVVVVIAIASNRSDPRKTFGGNIVANTECTATLFPTSSQDAAHALAYANAVGSHTTVRSGRIGLDNEHFLNQNMMIDLRGLRDVRVGKESFLAMSGATAQEVANKLHKEDKLISFDGNLQRCVVSTVLSDRPGQAPRTLARPSKHVKSVTLALPDGRLQKEKVSSSEDIKRALTNVVGKNRPIITDLEFSHIPVSQTWASRFSFPYSTEFHTEAVEALLRHHTTDTFNDLDVTLRVASSGGFSQMPLLIVTMIGKGEHKEDEREKLLVAVLPSFHLDFNKSRPFFEHVHGNSAVMKFLGEDLPGSSGSNEHDGNCKEYEGTVDKTKPKVFVDSFCRFVAEALEKGDVTADLQLLEDDEILVDVFTFLPQGEELVDKPMLDLGLNPVTEKDNVVSTVSDEREAERTEFYEEIRRAYLQPDHDLKKAGFKGHISLPTDRMYNKGAKPYAASSYDPKFSTPFMVLYPKDSSDVIKAINYAKSIGKYVVGRSGGHQYSGKSTGGEDTIVLVMSWDKGMPWNRSECDFVKDPILHKFSKDDVHVRLGVGLSLDKISKFLVDNGCSIPHGECPKVCIGGHAQSGGFGHMIRSFGLTLDYVRSFKAILADVMPGETELKEYEVVAPDTDLPVTGGLPRELNDQVFGGVLGGGPGSFAIVTEYEFKVILDENHKNCWGASKPMLYEENVFNQALVEMQKMTEDPKPGVDYFLSVISDGGFLKKSGFMLLEMLYGDTKEANTPTSGAAYFKPILGRIKKKMSLLPWLGANLASAVYRKYYEGKMDLSKTAHYGVRDLAKTDYREFNMPYKKRVNGFYEAMSDDFVKNFTKLVTEVVRDKELKLVVQMLVGGGKLKENAKEPNNNGNKLPHRGISWGVVFDVFYPEGNTEQLRNAEEKQAKMTKILKETMKDQDNVRVFWGSYGGADETNMTKEKVIRQYYGNENLYKEFQALKKKVDSTDVFHTDFTVQLP